MDPSLVTRLQQEWNNNPQDLAQIDALLRTAMIQLSTAGIGGADGLPGSNPEQMQQIIETGAMWSIDSKDQKSFERYTSLLFPIYFDAKHSASLKNLPTNAPMYSILGLYLLNLLVSNRLADFYMGLERITATSWVDVNNVFIQFPVQLQQCLVEGTFHRVILARQQVPSPEYAWFIDGLMDTIRNELAACLEKSFKHIDLASAAKLLLLTPEQIPQLVKFAEQRGWNLDANKVFHFNPKASSADDVPTMSRELILQSLGYARELEQII